MRVHFGAARLRRTVATLERDDAMALVTRLFPELSHRRVCLLLDHMDETVINGAYLIMPDSWDALLGDHTSVPKPDRTREGARQKETPGV